MCHAQLRPCNNVPLHWHAQKNISDLGSRWMCTHFPRKTPTRNFGLCWGTTLTTHLSRKVLCGDGGVDGYVNGFCVRCRKGQPQNNTAYLSGGAETRKDDKSINIECLRSQPEQSVPQNHKPLSFVLLICLETKATWLHSTNRSHQRRPDLGKVA